MWVSQTYLGTVEPNADLFVYYMYEDYNDQHMDFTSALEREMSKLGYSHGHRVQLFLPQNDHRGAIISELRKLEPLWWSLSGKLPGLLLSRKQLRDVDTSRDEVLYIPFAEKSPEGAAILMRDVRRIVHETIEQNDSRQPGRAPTTLSFGRRFF